MNILDTIITAVSPSWGLRRIAARQALRYYQAGEVNRFSSSWLPVNTVDQENMDKTERALICARARYLERNSDMANSAILGIIRNVVNTGIRMQARTENEELNTKIEALWNEWCRPGHCDVTGQQSFYEMQRMILRRKIVDGEILCKLVTDRKHGLQLQLIRADLLDTNLMTVPNSQHVIRSGIELDPYLRPIAYWIQKKDPLGYVTLEPEQVPASQILHLWTKNHPDQIRGISDLAVSIKRIKDTDDYLDAETVAARIAACFSVFIVQNTPQLPGRPGMLHKDKEDKPTEKIRPGMIMRLQPGEDVKAANPGRSATTAADFVNIHERLIGSGLGLSYEMMSRDFNKSSYSAARQGNLEDRRTFRPIQQWMITHFCQPVYEAFLDQAVLSGKLPEIRDYWTQPEKYRACEWIAPGWQSIDPEKEAKADTLSMQNGMLTLAQQCAEHGSDWRDQLAQMAREKEYAESLGLSLNIHTSEAVQAAQANHTEGENTNEGSNES